MKFFQLIPSETKIDFIGKFYLFVAISILTIGAAFFGMATKGFNFGVDFTGGTVVQARFSSPKRAEEVRTIMTELGEKDASVVEANREKTEYLITARTLQTKDQPTLDKRLVEKVGAAGVTILSTDVVGPKVGVELKEAALRSLFYSVVLIMVYIWFRFDFRFAPGATIAMIHDLILAAGFYVFSGREFSITAIAALLTIAGYSVNDTIVIYDRVRELLKITGDAVPLGQTINRAINLTLSRTLLTSGITFLSVIPLILFCEGEIENFAVAIAIGIFVGSYSTIYIAAPLTIYVDRYFSKHKTGARPVTAKI